MLVEVPAHGSSATIFPLAGTPVTGTPHLGEVIPMLVFHCFPQVGLVNVEKLVRVPDQTAERSEVAYSYTPMIRTGLFCRVALLELAPRKHTTLWPHYVTAWDVDVQ